MASGAGSASPSPVNLAPYRSFLLELAEASGDFIRPLFGRHDVAVELKADQTPVTFADRGAEELLRRMIARRWPDHGVIGEELGSDRPEAEFVWMLDPVDGTKAFVTGVPLFGTLIALLHQGQPVLGCIHQPILRQLMIGDGATTTLNGTPVRCRPDRPLAEATLLACDWLSPAVHQDGAAFDRLARSVKLCRTWGDCYGYLLLAGGWADLAVDPIMNPWDIAALVPVVRGAGGVISDWSGGPAFPAKSTLAAATPELHAAALRVLGGK